MALRDEMISRQSDCGSPVFSGKSYRHDALGESHPLLIADLRIPEHAGELPLLSRCQSGAVHFGQNLRECLGMARPSRAAASRRRQPAMRLEHEPPIRHLHEELTAHAGSHAPKHVDAESGANTLPERVDQISLFGNVTCSITDEQYTMSK